MTGAADSGMPAREPLQPIDWILGEGSAEQRAAMDERTARDPLLALELAETVELLERMRTLTVEPGPRLGFELARLCRQAEVRQRLRSGSGVDAAAWGVFFLAAAVVLAALMLWQPLRQQERPLPRGEIAAAGAAERGGREVAGQPGAGATGAAADLAPPFSAANEPRLYAALERFADRSGPDPLSGWLDPSNALMVQWLETELRVSPELRRRALRSNGGNPDVDDRVQELAAEIAGRVAAELAGGAASPVQVSVALRALLAAGSTPTEGAHAAVVAACEVYLREVAGRETLDTGDLVRVLAALAEPAVFRGATHGVLRRQGERLVRETLAARGRPTLLGWSTSLGALADAGRLLAVLPAYGVDPVDAFRVRRLLVAHLEERRAEEHGPEVLVAQLYGYGDLVDRAELERQLRSWRLTALLPDFEALWHLAWSREAGGAGWTRFQRELRRLATVPAPRELVDQAALVMCLATDFAAPGVARLRSLAD